MSFEDDLRQALQREQTPTGFAARVLAGAEMQQAPPPRSSALRLWTAIAAGIALLVLLPASLERHQREAREGALAEQQLMRALRLTSHKLKMTQSLLREMSER